MGGCIFVLFSTYPKADVDLHGKQIDRIDRIANWYSTRWPVLRVRAVSPTYDYSTEKVNATTYCTLCSFKSNTIQLYWWCIQDWMGKEGSESQTPKRLSRIIYYVACEFFSAFKKCYSYDLSKRIIYLCFLLYWLVFNNQQA